MSAKRSADYVPLSVLDSASIFFVSHHYSYSFFEDVHHCCNSYEAQQQKLCVELLNGMVAYLSEVNAPNREIVSTQFILVLI